jgi:hypothetical protein
VVAAVVVMEAVVEAAPVWEVAGWEATAAVVAWVAVVLHSVAAEAVAGWAAALHSVAAEAAPWEAEASAVVAE